MPDFNTADMHMSQDMVLQIPEGPTVHIYNPTRQTYAGQGGHDEVQNFLDAFMAMPPPNAAQPLYPAPFIPEGEVEFEPWNAQEQNFVEVGMDDGFEGEDGAEPPAGPVMDFVAMMGLDDPHYDDNEDLDERHIAQVLEWLFGANQAVIEQPALGEEPAPTEEQVDA
ncbi:hypothetical protein OH77DRAFT_1509411 [Trametes cingulata]|nr:hypothetical protein OH77DRAFT_1509411 [Trametes cingulata]